MNDKPTPDWGQLATLLALVLVVGAVVTGAIAAATEDSYTVGDYISDLALFAFALAALVYAWHHRHHRHHEPTHAGTSYQRSTDPPITTPRGGSSTP